MKDNMRNDDYDGYIRLKVTPSDLLDLGISININDHINIQTDSAGSQESTGILLDNWSPSLNRADRMTTNFWNNIDL